MPTECNPELFEFTPVEGRQVAGGVRWLGRSPRMLERCCWVRRIERSG